MKNNVLGEEIDNDLHSQAAEMKKQFMKLWDDHFSFKEQQTNAIKDLKLAISTKLDQGELGVSERRMVDNLNEFLRDHDKLYADKNETRAKIQGLAKDVASFRVSSFCFIDQIIHQT